MYSRNKTKRKRRQGNAPAWLEMGISEQQVLHQQWRPHRSPCTAPGHEPPLVAYTACPAAANQRKPSAAPSKHSIQRDPSTLCNPSNPHAKPGRRRGPQVQGPHGRGGWQQPQPPVRYHNPGKRRTLQEPGLRGGVPRKSGRRWRGGPGKAPCRRWWMTMTHRAQSRWRAWAPSSGLEIAGGFRFRGRETKKNEKKRLKKKMSVNRVFNLIFFVEDLVYYPAGDG